MRLFALRILVVVALLALLPVLSNGKIKDGIICSSCHTMHNTQHGQTMTAASTEALLNDSCVGCHSGTNINPALSGFPYVYDPTGAPTYGATGTSGHDTLAGGNFYWVVNVSDRKGHNVVGIAGNDDTYGFGVAGQKNIPGSNPPTMLGAGEQLTCAGVNGCHGNGAGTELESLRPGSHHIADDPTLGNSVANSFRFLSGIKGNEDADWEFTVSETDHNQYQGSIGAGTDTVTSLCTGCHGDFHATGTTPFLRHPVDINLPGTGEYASYITYKPETPVASVDISAVLDNVQGADEAIISCVSCHRAHGSPWDGILRWDYKSWPGGGFDGCGLCHSVKN
jgi:hypothetical protein